MKLCLFDISGISKFCSQQKRSEWQTKTQKTQSSWFWADSVSVKVLLQISGEWDQTEPGWSHDIFLFYCGLQAKTPARGVFEASHYFPFGKTKKIQIFCFSHSVSVLLSFTLSLVFPSLVSRVMWWIRMSESDYLGRSAKQSATVWRPRSGV